ncbi:MAG: hypothetical protein Ct9H300mP12_02230 [Acidimicrobiales bacterium]|nr:MAG: hypothetical protein Ct9H300mP12_02230 [Acidimicrobiales bacterium]
MLELVGLEGLGDRRTHRLSGGQKRRIDLALGIIGDPDLLFLDEPTTGFDPSARRQAWEMVDGLRSLGTTIVLTSHYMDEVQARAPTACWSSPTGGPWLPVRPTSCGARWTEGRAHPGSLPV